MKTRLRALAALVAVLVAAAFFAAPAMAAGVEGTLDAKGLEKLVRESKGTPVVLNFFATWCPPCRAEIPDLVEMHEAYKGRVVLVGLTVDDERTYSQVAPFLKRMGIEYRVFRAAPDLVGLFGIRSIPYNVGYGADGKMAWAYAGVAPKDQYEEMLKQLLK